MDSRFSCLILVSLSVLGQSTLANSVGVVLLDELIFDKVTSKFAVTLLKLDSAYPYGEKHVQFTEFGKQQNVLTDDLLIADVHIKDYGERENFGILQRFNIQLSDLPVILLFKKPDLNKYIQYPADSDVTVYNLKNFVRRNTNLYIGLSGCIKEFDLMATDYMARFNRNEFNELDKLIEHASRMIEGFTDEKKQRATAYLQIMKRIREKGISFREEEKARVEKLLTTKLSEAKKKELQNRLNVILSFRDMTHSSSEKMEL